MNIMISLAMTLFSWAIVECNYISISENTTMNLLASSSTNSIIYTYELPILGDMYIEMLGENKGIITLWISNEEPIDNVMKDDCIVYVCVLPKENSDPHLIPKSPEGKYYLMFNSTSPIDFSFRMYNELIPIYLEDNKEIKIRKAIISKFLPFLYEKKSTCDLKIIFEAKAVRLLIYIISNEIPYVYNVQIGKSLNFTRLNQIEEKYDIKIKTDDPIPTSDVVLFTIKTQTSEKIPFFNHTQTNLKFTNDGQHAGFFQIKSNKLVSYGNYFTLNANNTSFDIEKTVVNINRIKIAKSSVILSEKELADKLYEYIPFDSSNIKLNKQKISNSYYKYFIKKQEDLSNANDEYFVYYLKTPEVLEEENNDCYFCVPFNVEEKILNERTFYKSVSSYSHQPFLFKFTNNNSYWIIVSSHKQIKMHEIEEINPDNEYHTENYYNIKPEQKEFIIEIDNSQTLYSVLRAENIYLSIYLESIIETRQQSSIKYIDCSYENRRNFFYFMDLLNNIEREYIENNPLYIYKRVINGKFTLYYEDNKRKDGFIFPQEIMTDDKALVSTIDYSYVVKVICIDYGIFGLTYGHQHTDSFFFDSLKEYYEVVTVKDYLLIIDKLRQTNLEIEVTNPDSNSITFEYNGITYIMNKANPKIHITIIDTTAINFDSKINSSVIFRFSKDDLYKEITTEQNDETLAITTSNIFYKLYDPQVISYTFTLKNINVVTQIYYRIDKGQRAFIPLATTPLISNTITINNYFDKLANDDFYYFAISTSKESSYDLQITKNVLKLMIENTMTPIQTNQFYSLDKPCDPTSDLLVFYFLKCDEGSSTLTLLSNDKIIHNIDIEEQKQKVYTYHCYPDHTASYNITYKSTIQSIIKNHISYAYMAFHDYRDINEIFEKELEFSYNNELSKMTWAPLTKEFDKFQIFYSFVQYDIPLDTICDSFNQWHNNTIIFADKKEYSFTKENMPNGKYKVKLMALSSLPITYQIGYKTQILTIIDKNFYQINYEKQEINDVNVYYKFTNDKVKKYNITFIHQGNSFDIQYEFGKGNTPIFTNEKKTMKSNEILLKDNTYVLRALSQEQDYDYLVIYVPFESLPYTVNISITPKDQIKIIDKNEITPITEKISTSFIGVNQNITKNQLSIYSLSCDSATPTINVVHNDISDPITIDSTKQQTLTNHITEPYAYYLEYTKNGNNTPNHMSYSFTTEDKYKETKEVIEKEHSIVYNNITRTISWDIPNNSMIKYNVYITKKDDTNQINSLCDLIGKTPNITLNGTTEIVLSKKQYPEGEYIINIVGINNEDQSYYIGYKNSLAYVTYETNILWLWILLGIVGSALILVIIILIHNALKKKKLNDQYAEIDQVAEFTEL